MGAPPGTGSSAQPCTPRERGRDVTSEARSDESVRPPKCTRAPPPRKAENRESFAKSGHQHRLVQASRIRGGRELGLRRLRVERSRRNRRRRIVIRNDG